MRFPDCPAIAPGSLGKPLGFGFSCNPEYKTLLPPFFFDGSFCVSHSLRDWGEEQDHPSEKMRRCITGEPSLAAGKISRAFQIVPPSLRAVWESPWGSDFHAIWNIKHYSHLFPRWKLLCFPFPAGLGEMMWSPRCKNAPVHNGRAIPRRGKNLPRFPNCPAIAPGGLGKPLGFEFP